MKSRAITEETEARRNADGGSSARAPLRALPPLLGLGSLLLVAVACTPLPGPRTFDSAEYVRAEYAARVGEDEAAGLEVPFQLSEEIQAAVAERLNAAQSERRRVDQVLDFVFGYLDLEYTLTPTRSAVETYRHGAGNCLSFVNLFVGIARELRLNPFYVEVEDYQRWNVSHGTVVSHGHIVAGLRIDGELSTFDFLPYRPKSYRHFNPIDDIKATAHYYNNLGAEALLAGDLEEASRLTGIAVDLAPEFVKAINNRGVVSLREGDAAAALETYRSGLELEPDNVALLTNSARALQELGRNEEADEYLARLERTNSSNPFFFVYRGELALARGESREALELMRKAFRRDSEVPEVHVGLLKVYLALGERRKALHHLERALTLDATHAEARKYAALLLDRPTGESGGGP